MRVLHGQCSAQDLAWLWSMRINTVMKFLDEFSEWKGKALKTTFKEYFESGNTIEKKETSQGQDCCHMEIPFIPGITPEPMTCSQCKAIHGDLISNSTAATRPSKMLLQTNGPKFLGLVFLLN
uniref:Sieve element occlusion C-terminal domain-containing protein n=1 Tax=Fagus sylvatica TaxID=28930 RepID=A0A2N9GTA2_FAGSY